MNIFRTSGTLAWCLLAAAATLASAAGEGMPQMPLAREKSSRIVTSSDDFGALRGFGPGEQSARLRALMMVGGSGHEGMEMTAPAAARASDGQVPFEIQWTSSPSPPVAGLETLALTLVDPKTRKPITGLEVRLEISMAAMDMGTQAIPAPETEPGRYRAELKLPMAGTWAIRVRTRLGATVFRLEVGAPH
jgi:hypothetical protein